MIDRVWLSSTNLPLKGGVKKPQPHFLGPFVVSGIINPGAVYLDLSFTLQVYMVFHVSKLKPIREISLEDPLRCPPLSRLLDGVTVKNLHKFAFQNQ